MIHPTPGAAGVRAPVLFASTSGNGIGGERRSSPRNRMPIVSAGGTLVITVELAPTGPGISLFAARPSAVKRRDGTRIPTGNARARRPLAFSLPHRPLTPYELIFACALHGCLPASVLMMRGMPSFPVGTK